MKYNNMLKNPLILGAILTTILFDNIFYIECIAKNYNQELEIQKNIEIWDSEAQNMPTPRYSFSTVALNGKIYCIGGRDNTTTYGKVEIYDTIINTWSQGKDMPTPRYSFSATVVNGEIYCIGGRDNTTTYGKVEIYDTITNTWRNGSDMTALKSLHTSSVIGNKIYIIGEGLAPYYNYVEVYDTLSNTWEVKSYMPNVRYGLTSEVIDDKIFCIGGNHFGSEGLDTVDLYIPQSDSWENKSTIPTARSELVSVVIDEKIYCMGGRNTYITNKVEVYDPEADTWSEKTNMPTSKIAFGSEYLNGKIYTIGGYDGDALDKIEIYTVKIFPEQEAENKVVQAETSKDPADIETARILVNQLPESLKKEQLQARLDAIQPNISLKRKNATSNLDLYIKCENMLLMSLDTNSITFDDFSGVADMEKANIVNITVTSSLPYRLNAYLPTEIQSSDKLNTMDKTILNIKENSEVEYKTFVNTVDKVVLKDNCIAGNDIVHGVDIKLKGSITHEKDVYKTTIKFEIQQK